MLNIWVGAGIRAERLLKKLKKLGADDIPVVILDNDESKIGTEMLGVPIDAVSNIANYLVEPYKISVTVINAAELILQLQELGVRGRIVPLSEIEYEISKPLLQRNSMLFDNKKSNRCFILGTGPSLLKQNLQWLEAEDTIVVNHTYKDDRLVSLNPNYWVIADPGFWMQKEIYLDPVLTTMRDRLPSTQLFINADACSHMNSGDAAQERVFYYLLEPTANYEVTQIGFEKPLPLFAQNVISVAIMLAIGLKYQEIILIGCDHSWWAYSREDIAMGIMAPHCYKESEKDASNVQKSLEHDKLQVTIHTQKREYSALRAIAELSSIKIRNATIGGHLESFERVNYEEMFR